MRAIQCTHTQTYPLWGCPAFGRTDDDRPTRKTLARFGYAHFESLRINEAGVGYRLGFNATGLGFSLDGGSYVESKPFSVGIGPAHSLGLEADILDGTIVSGSPFHEQVE